MDLWNLTNDCGIPKGSIGKTGAVAEPCRLCASLSARKTDDAETTAGGRGNRGLRMRVDRDVDRQCPRRVCGTSDDMARRKTGISPRTSSVQTAADRAAGETGCRRTTDRCCSDGRGRDEVSGNHSDSADDRKMDGRAARGEECRRNDGTTTDDARRLRRVNETLRRLTDKRDRLARLVRGDRKSSPDPLSRRDRMPPSAATDCRDAATMTDTWRNDGAGSGSPRRSNRPFRETSKEEPSGRNPNGGLPSARAKPRLDDGDLRSRRDDQRESGASRRGGATETLESATTTRRSEENRVTERRSAENRVTERRSGENHGVTALRPSDSLAPCVQRSQQMTRRVVAPRPGRSCAASGKPSDLHRACPIPVVTRWKTDSKLLAAGQQIRWSSSSSGSDGDEWYGPMPASLNRIAGVVDCVSSACGLLKVKCPPSRRSKSEAAADDKNTVPR